MNNIKDKIKDMFSAGVDETVSLVLSSDATKGTVNELVSTLFPILPETASFMASLFTMITPRIQGIWLNYKEARFERNTKEALRQFGQRLDDIETKIGMLSEPSKEKYKSLYSEWLLDSIEKEKQINKIPYIINGFVNTIADDASEDHIRLFYETLDEVTMLDIDLLKFYSICGESSIDDLLEKYNLSFEELSVVKEKLTRMGLLENLNDRQRTDNISEMTKYFISLEKESHKAKPKQVKVSSKIKNERTTRGYRITKLGRGLVEMITTE